MAKLEPLEEPSQQQKQKTKTKTKTNHGSTKFFVFNSWWHDSSQLSDFTKITVHSASGIRFIAQVVFR
ncbi:unnamed protein product [Camellia sinensis]